MRTGTVTLAALAAISLGGCAIRDARIAMPSELAASAERLELRGMGGGTGGDFELAGARGRFNRSAERLALLDPLLVRHSGGGSFALAASAGGPELAGRCRYQERQVNAGPVAVTPGRFAYVCGFARGGVPIDAELVIEDPQSAFGTLHGRAERRGTLFFEGRRLAVRSIHRDAGGGLPAPTPLGYLFEADGEAVGAVDVNGTGKTLFAPREGPLREAVLAGGLALAIL